MRLNLDAPIISIAVGIIAMIIAIVIYFETGAFILNKSTTKGKIIDIIAVGINPNKTDYYPLIEFNTKNNERVRFQLNKNYPEYKIPKIGDEVEVIYNAKKPTRVIVKDEKDKNKWHTILFAGFGLLFTILGFWEVLSNNKAFKKLHYE
jgi:hypothetical protein